MEADISKRENLKRSTTTVNQSEIKKEGSSGG